MHARARPPAAAGDMVTPSNPLSPRMGVSRIKKVAGAVHLARGWLSTCPAPLHSTAQHSTPMFVKLCQPIMISCIPSSLGLAS